MTPEVEHNKGADKEPQQPQQVQVPEAQHHPSKPVATAYQDPNAPKLKRKLHAGRALLLLLVLMLLAGGGAVLYQQLQDRDDESSVISDYGGGIAEPDTPESVVTAETEAAKRFLQAIQAKDGLTVDQLASEALKQQVKLETKNDSASVLSYFEGRFDGIDLDILISSVSEASDELGAAGKQVTFSDKAATEGASGTYHVNVLVVGEAGTLKINSITTSLDF